MVTYLFFTEWMMRKNDNKVDINYLKPNFNLLHKSFLWPQNLKATENEKKLSG